MIFWVIFLVSFVSGSRGLINVKHKSRNNSMGYKNKWILLSALFIFLGILTYFFFNRSALVFQLFDFSKEVILHRWISSYLSDLLFALAILSMSFYFKILKIPKFYIYFNLFLPIAFEILQEYEPQFGYFDKFDLLIFVLTLIIFYICSFLQRKVNTL